MDTLRYLNKDFNQNERRNFSNWWKEQIEIYGQEIVYQSNLTSLSNAYPIYGENPAAGFNNGRKLIVLLNLNNDSIILSKFGLIADSDITGVIHPEMYKKIYGEFAEPKADDLMVLEEFGIDRLNYPKRGPTVYQLTEVIDEFQGNPLGGHYVWFFKAKRYDYSQEPNSAGPGVGNTAISDNSFAEYRSYLNFNEVYDNACSDSSVYGTYQAPLTSSQVDENQFLSASESYDLYTPLDGLKIYALINKSANIPEAAIEEIKLAVNFWSKALKNTKLPGQEMPSDLYDGIKYITNPLKFINDGIVLYINQFEQDENILAAGSYNYVRHALGKKYHLLPSVGYLALNSLWTNNLLDYNEFYNNTKLYNVILHEIGHCLGIGTCWHTLKGSKLERSFVVGAEDYSTNTLNGLAGNVFYTIDLGDKNRTSNDVGTLGNLPDSSFYYAYNPDSAVGNKSEAVFYYNQSFGLNLSAIPVESNLGVGSYGCHWAEGSLSLSGNYVGADRRQYYGQTYPGAPCLQEELMTPVIDNLNYMPCSKITLGALADLGWEVDYSVADVYEPLKHVIRDSRTQDNVFEVSKNNCNKFVATVKNNELVLFTHLRKGLTYTFINETTDKLTFSDGVSSLINNITSSYLGDGTPCTILYISPENYNTDQLVITGSIPDSMSWDLTYKRCIWRVV